MSRPLAISALLLCALALWGAAPLHARTRPRYGDTLRVETTADAWDRPGGLARRLVLEGLTAVSPDGSIRPALAVSWASENNDHRWQFRLRPGVHFHDGSAVTSIALVTALNAACADNCPWDNIHALSSSLVFTSDSPMPQLPALLAGDDFLIAKAGATPDGGTGPFQVSGFANGALTLSASDASWAGRPFVDAIEIRVHRPVAEQWADLAAGRADLVQVPPEQIRQARQQHLSLLVSPTVDVLALQLPASGSSSALRSAIAYAIDRDALANVIFQRQGIAAGAFLPQYVSGFAFLFPAARDLNKAHEFRGGANPPPLQLEADGEVADQLAAQRIVLNLREAGFPAQTAHAAPSSTSVRLRRFRMESADTAADLDAIARTAGEAAPESSPDPAAVYRAERELLSRGTLIPLVDLPRAFAVGSRVRDLRLLFDGTPDLCDVSLEPIR